MDRADRADQFYGLPTRSGRFNFGKILFVPTGPSEILSMDEYATEISSTFEFRKDKATLEPDDEVQIKR